MLRGAFFKTVDDGIFHNGLKEIFECHKLLHLRETLDLKDKRAAEAHLLELEIAAEQVGQLVQRELVAALRETDPEISGQGQDHPGRGVRVFMAGLAVNGVQSIVQEVLVHLGLEKRKLSLLSEQLLDIDLVDELLQPLDHLVVPVEEQADLIPLDRDWSLGECALLHIAQMAHKGGNGPHHIPVQDQTAQRDAQGTAQQGKEREGPSAAGAGEDDIFRDTGEIFPSALYGVIVGDQIVGAILLVGVSPILAVLRKSLGKAAVLANVLGRGKRAPIGEEHLSCIIADPDRTGVQLQSGKSGLPGGVLQIADQDALFLLGRT